MTYNKPPMTVDALIDQLMERGLSIDDTERARRYLRHIGYYRLSPYLIPFQQRGGSHIIRRGTTLDDVINLYVFDRDLRQIVMDALERVEIAVRASLSDYMSNTYTNPHWYLDVRHFANGDKHAGFLQLVEETCDEQLRSKPDPGQDNLEHRSALEHYLTKYASPELPPSWLMIETLTLGQLRGVYSNLKARHDKTEIAAVVGLTQPVLESWLQTYVRVRNICAHHGRLWNVGLGVYPAIPTSSKVRWLEVEGALPEASQKRLYPVLVSLQSILATVSPHSHWSHRLQRLVDSRPAMNLRGMGIPADWTSDPFWRRHLET